jgi:hypothetical protein
VLDGRWRREEDDNMNYVTNGQIYIGIVILLISAILSFSSKKIGIISNITICAITIFFGIGGVYVGASIESLDFGLVVFLVRSDQNNSVIKQIFLNQD